jgi:hypothetical protein
MRIARNAPEREHRSSAQNVGSRALGLSTERICQRASDRAATHRTTDLERPELPDAYQAMTARADPGLLQLTGDQSGRSGNVSTKSGQRFGVP